MEGWCGSEVLRASDCVVDIWPELSVLGSGGGVVTQDHHHRRRLLGVSRLTLVAKYHRLSDSPAALKGALVLGHPLAKAKFCLL